MKKTTATVTLLAILRYASGCLGPSTSEEDTTTRHRIAKVLEPEETYQLSSKPINYRQR